jgi:Surface adhesin CshA repetitive domain
VLKQFILGALLIAGLSACVIPPEPIVSTGPIAKDDLTTTNPTTATTIKPADNDLKGDYELVPSSIDLNPSTTAQDASFSDTTGKGKFTLSSGIVTFTPVAGKTGDATAKYTIKDLNGNISSAATIKVTVSAVVNTGPLNVLFIGNSRTVYPPCSITAPNIAGVGYNIPSILKAMNPQMSVTALAYCGHSLQQHWNDGTVPGTARYLIAQGNWDYVVLQANTIETNSVSDLQNIVSQFHNVIKTTKAKTVLYENWWKTTVSTQAIVTPVFEGAANNLGIKLAPAGEAWKLSGLSDAQLFNTDGDLVHATPLGAYAAASSFNWLFYGKAPSSTAGIPTSVSAAEATLARTGAQSAYAALAPGLKILP